MGKAKHALFYLKNTYWPQTSQGLDGSYAWV